MTRVAVVTGATGGLGSAFVRALASDGWQVAVLARQPDRVRELADQTGGLAVPADVTDPDALDAAARTVGEHWGRVDAVVAAAGGNRPSATTGEQPLPALPARELRAVVELNLLGTMFTTQAFLPLLARDGAASRGCVVTIGSMAADRPLTRVPAYAAAKAGVAAYTRWLAVHLAQEVAPGLRAVCLAPGFIVTEQNRALLTTPDGDLTRRGSQVVAHTPAGRLGTTDDVVGALLWLVSDAAAAVTGVVLPVDLGFSAYAGV